MFGLLKILLATLVPPPCDVLHHVGLTVRQVVLGDVLDGLDGQRLVMVTTNLNGQRVWVRTYGSNVVLLSL